VDPHLEPPANGHLCRLVVCRSFAVMEAWERGRRNLGRLATIISRRVGQEAVG